MKRFFGKIFEDTIIFDEAEAKHISQVLRMQVGDEVIGCINDEFNYFCTLLEIHKNKVVAKINKKQLCMALPNNNITLFIAMPKREYFETIITKSVELGVNKIVPFISKFSVNHSFKRDRVSQLVTTACKQCERSKLMEVSEIVTFDTMLDQLKDYNLKLFANEREDESFNFTKMGNCKNIAIIVGCEGGFDKEEITKIINMDANSVSLGKRILRCDTACVAMLAVVNVLSKN